MTTRMEYYTVNDDSFGSNINNGNNLDAQNFTIGTTGANVPFNVSSVDMKLHAEDASGVVAIEIQEVKPDGSPDGTAISTGTHSYVAADGTQWVNITMTSVTLQRSKQYALVLKFISGSNIAWRYDLAGGTYGGGNRFTSADAGSTWTNQAAHECLFQINGGDYGGTLCTLADAANKAGANAATNATNEVLVSDYVKQAEGLISSTTRFDWIDAYSALSDDVKFILNRTASALAAIDIIAYDMSGYTTATAEAETMINIYREEGKQGLKLLESQNVRKFITEDT